MDTLDWSLIRSFLAVVETGSLSAAARKTGQSQPTLGRHVRALEDAVGAELFRRIPSGLEPSAAGVALIAPARAMAEAAARLSLAAEGGSASLEGAVRITASHMVSHYLLPPILARIRQAEPKITLDLVPSDSTENLLFREADIALRMYPPTQLDLVSRKLTDLPMAMYAATSYLDRVGRPETLEQAMTLDFVGFDRSESMTKVLNDLGSGITRDSFTVRCDHQPALWELVRAGCGVSVAQLRIADNDPTVERVRALDAIPLPPLGLWIAAPGAIRTTPRIRRVWDLLVAALVPNAGVSRG
ncbi:LysR family transcriptional regulator [Pararhodobacter zhoushanensis]|uniref:LysR family transcriptional regulator n=1 Tax=Pararhodobacter zhoushanensis TaxID=2479545 RepID=A0ABT3GUV1_9RHOB|nr:LysR family transcriptional regulator [Pararhodobacter zhoushanensis]MCW1931323.1 LysR family transcriptional regulator [Pararhodobacter zhoushanensis]